MTWQLEYETLIFFFFRVKTWAKSYITKQRYYSDYWNVHYGGHLRSMTFCIAFGYPDTSMWMKNQSEIKQWQYCRVLMPLRSLQSMIKPITAKRWLLRYKFQRNKRKNFYNKVSTMAYCGLETKVSVLAITESHPYWLSDGKGQHLS